MMETRKIADIRIGERYREEMGDIAALAASIQANGLLHPIVIWSDNTLIVGQRRLEAYKKLARTEIPINIANDMPTLSKLLQAECDENICRKDFTPEEAVRIGEAIEKEASKQSQKAAQEGRKKGGGDKKSKEVQNRTGKTFPKAIRDESKRTTAVAAKAVGMSRPSYEKAKKVVEEGDTALITEMNRTGKVSGAYKKMRCKQAKEKIQKTIGSERRRLCKRDHLAKPSRPI